MSGEVSLDDVGLGEDMYETESFNILINIRPFKIHFIFSVFTHVLLRSCEAPGGFSAKPFLRSSKRATFPSISTALSHPCFCNPSQSSARIKLAGVLGVFEAAYL